MAGLESDQVRILYVLLSILSAGFPGILTYIILWVVMPEERPRRSEERA